MNYTDLSVLCKVYSMNYTGAGEGADAGACAVCSVHCTVCSVQCAMCC